MGKLQIHSFKAIWKKPLLLLTRKETVKKCVDGEVIPDEPWGHLLELQKRFIPKKGSHRYWILSGRKEITY